MMGRAYGRIRLRRTVALGLVACVILLLGILIKGLPGDWTLTTEQKGRVGNAPVSTGAVDPVLFDRQRWQLGLSEGEAKAAQDHAGQALEEQTRILFEHALALLQAGDHARAIKALELVITVAPWMPEAFVNLGFALYEVGELEAARGAFLRAIELNRAQGNAYYGVAITYEALGDLELALGAMRTFLHITEGQERFKSRARAAIWEWEASLNGRKSASEADPSATATAN